jgi:hypothetical protein
VRREAEDRGSCRRWPGCRRAIHGRHRNILQKYPFRHWRRIRTANAVERSFREVRGRVRGKGRGEGISNGLLADEGTQTERRRDDKREKLILAKIKASKLERIAA